jgi:hypothetical protein
VVHGVAETLYSRHPVAFVELSDRKPCPEVEVKDRRPFYENEDSYRWLNADRSSRTNDFHASAELPAGLYRVLDPFGDDGSPLFDAPRLASDALNLAAVNYGRSLVGLTALPYFTSPF